MFELTTLQGRKGRSILTDEKRSVDLNAHIETLECSIVVENNKPYGIISFTNLGYGTLTAIKLIARGFNSFGDEILVNGKNEFFIILQDLSIPINTKASDIKVNIPDFNIRHIDIREGQLVFAGGKTTSYNKPNIREYIVDILDSSDEHESKVLEILRTYESSAICLPSKNETGWICVCGQFNCNDSEQCSKCAKQREETFSLAKPEELERRILQRHEEKIAMEERKKEEEVNAQKQRKKRNLFIALGLLATAGVIALIINASILSSRITYESADEMIDSLEGTWLHYSSYSDSVLWTVEIDGDTLTQTYTSDGFSLDTDITYYPSQGYFKAFGNKYIVKDKGYQTIIVENNYVYEKGVSYTPSVSSSTTTSSKFDTYLSENNILLDNSDVQYNMSNNVDKVFSLVGYAELDDYYNYGFDDDIESSYFCLAVTPSGGSYSDMWYIYCDRDSFQKLFDKVQDSEKIYVQMVCKIPSYRYEKNQQCMAQLEYVVY